MNRSLLLQAACQAALLGACASLLAFDATASGRMAAALAPVDSTDAVVRTPAEAPSTDSPWVYLGPQRAQVARLAVSQVDPDRMLALLGREFDTPLVTSVFASSQAGHEWQRSVGIFGISTDVAMDESGRALAASNFAVYVQDPGETEWIEWLHPELNYALRPWRVAPSPGTGAPVWVTGHEGQDQRVYRLSHDISVWTDVTPALPDSWVFPSELAVSTTQPGRVAVAVVDAMDGAARVFITHDDGANWQASTAPGEASSLYTLRWVGDRVFMAGVTNGGLTSTLWASSDFGASWEVLLAIPTEEGFAMDVAADPAQPDRLWVGTVEGLYQSTDGGQTFTAPVPGQTPPIARLEFAPQRGQLWAGMRDSGTWVSSDGGATWEERNHRLGTQPVVSLASNARQPGEMAVGIRAFIHSSGQVATSLDGGLEWTQNTAPPSNTVGQVRFGPSGDLYATLTGWQQYTLMRRGPGNDWQHVGFEWPGNEHYDTGRLGFGDSEDTLLISDHYYNYDSFEQGYKVWRSGDAGQSWQQVLKAAEYNTYAGIERTQGPDGPRMLVLEQASGFDSPSHLWASDDDGQTWHDIASALPPGANGQFCTGADGHVVLHLHDVATGALRIYRSQDGGADWMQTAWTPGFVEGTPFTAMHCPGDARQVFLGGSWGQLLMSGDAGESFELLADESVWGDTWLQSILLTTNGLYVGHYNGAWVNPDITLAPVAPSALTVERTQARMRYRVTLQWEGGAGQVDIRHNGTLMATVPNIGQWSEGVLASRQAPTWQVCNAGTAECSAVVGGN